MARSPLGVGSAAVSGAQWAAAQDPKQVAKQTANSVSGFVIGALIDVLFIQYMHGGLPQLKAWLAAKFLNRGAGGAGAELGRILGTVPPPTPKA